MQQNVKSRQNVTGRGGVSGFVAIKRETSETEEIRSASAVKKSLILLGISEVQMRHAIYSHYSALFSHMFLVSGCT